MLENVCTGVVPEFFAAANSGRGFVSFYGEIFNTDKIKRRFLIKGGPGTGKSTLMRRIAESACRKGEQVCLYRCSSDPSSLDGVIINGEVAVIDSTAPHTVEPEPGPCDLRHHGGSRRSSCGRRLHGRWLHRCIFAVHP